MKKVLAFILFVAAIAAIIWLLIHFGILGKGSGSGKGKGDNSTSVSEIAESNGNTTENITTEEAAKAEKLEISVSKNEYVYNNNMTSFDELIKIVEDKDKNVQIEISIDDTAAKNTVDELTDKLDELGYKNYKKVEK
ncbi:hypothetical protein [Ruminococcus sp.]|uniref:hypothetical protein n=1 Tax=Ruminococcus sp. TaxID=41978 RepID=UPI0025D04A46|nr:hypothetical protein [Ruminococcus sp.]MCR4637775.1 hypothetical protein [Ruminococcus sp.]